MNVNLPNIERARLAWGDELPGWVRLLAEAADLTSQRGAAETIGKSSGYVSRIINRVYTGDYAEAEKLVRAAFGSDDVLCPVWGETIRLAACIHLRRQRAAPRDPVDHLYRAACPDCPNNDD